MGAASSPLYSRTQIHMGDIPVTITIQTTQKHKAYTAMERAFTHLKKLNATLSEWSPDSQTTLLNNHPGIWVSVGKDLMTILLQAQQISQASEGAFDVTWASHDPRLSYRDIDLRPELGLARLHKKRMKIGISSIAKGYIVDQIAQDLKRSGFNKFLIDAGDIYAAGTWKIFLKCPPENSSPCAKPHILHNQAISTSGLYERGNHIIDPRTGKVPQHHTYSATVIADTSFLASPLATAFFVMSPDEREDLKAHYPLIHTYFLAPANLSPFCFLH